MINALKNISFDTLGKTDAKSSLNFLRPSEINKIGYSKNFLYTSELIFAVC